MRTDIYTLANGSQRLTWRYQEARNGHLEFEAQHAEHVARLCRSKVACKRNPHVSLPRVSFVSEQYKPQTDKNLFLNPARYEAASFASKMAARRKSA